MKLAKIIRTNDWWEVKLTTFFALGYATALQAGMSLTELLPGLLLVILSIIVGAAYVSVVNDYTDLEEDLACGKHNRLAKFSPLQRRLILAATILPGLLFIIFLYREPISATCYLMAWVAFSLYSLPPFRFKTKGILGVLADASGAHLFPTLTVVAAVFYFSGKEAAPLWLGAAGVWAFTYGLRGILWHQFHDRENDLRAGLNTFAVKWTPARFRPVAFTLICIEVGALCTLLFLLNLPLVWAAFLLYFLLTATAKYLFRLQVILVYPVAAGRYYIFLSSFYQALFPVALLVSTAIDQPSVWWLVLLHFVLFPQKLLAGIENFRRVAGRIAAGRVG